MRSVTIQQNGEESTVENAVDVLNVGGTIRWANEDGTASSESGAMIRKAQSRVPFKVALKSPVSSEKRVYSQVTFVAWNPTDKMAYIVGPGTMERHTAEIVRVKEYGLH